MPDFLYVHVPFCIRKCIYCDFFSVPYDDSLAKTYINALCKELYLKKDSVQNFKKVYIGWGTPSLLPDECFVELFECLNDNFNLCSDAEITVEANPGTINESGINTLFSLGVNRLSIGIQSFNNDELTILGRIHTSEDAIRSVEIIRKEGLRNFSIDLMYGIPGQTANSWHSSISKAVELSPAHISAYELTPEGKTPLCELIESNEIRMPDEEIILEMYNHTIDYLSGFDYEHYEISNFALSGFRCIHNLNYWDRGGYVGAGAGAHSFLNETRLRNTEHLQAYIENLNGGIIPQIEETTVMRQEADKEFLFLGLRKTEGISIAKSEELGLNISGASRELIDEGYLEVEKGYLKFTRRGIMISNTVIVRLFETLGLP
jgi:oxygen-independent coproporphyrinogen-3 oxidase